MTQNTTKRRQYWNKSIIIEGDFNLHFNSKLEAKGGKLTLKKKSLGKMIELIESVELCDIWRIRHPAEKLHPTSTLQDTYSEGLIIF